MLPQIPSTMAALKAHHVPVTLLSKTLFFLVPKILAMDLIFGAP